MQKSRSEQTLGDPLAAGQTALARCAWGEARACFEAALRAEELPEALEGLAVAAWWLNDVAMTFARRVRAYQLYVQRGNHCGAARVAISLSIDHLYCRGEYAIANGWVQRARRLLADLELVPEVGWLALAEAQIALWADHDSLAAQRLSADAAAIGKSLGDVNLEMFALSCEGLALVSQGRISEGMRRLDETTVAAVAGEITNIDASCLACCFLIYACEWTRDYERAAEWLEWLRQLSTRWSHPHMFAFCRVHYASLLIYQGAWPEAETELVAAIGELEEKQPALAAEALVRLAELLCRQGRFDQVSALLQRAEAPSYRTLVSELCLLVHASAAFARDDLDRSVELVERFLRAIAKEARMERVGGMELLVEVLAARGDLVRGQVALEELRAAAASVNTTPMLAAARFAEGVMASAAAGNAAAKACFEDAVQLWTRSGAPFEAARARLGLAQSLLALGRLEAAEQQARVAGEVFERLDARPLVARVDAVLQQIRVAHPASGAKPSRTTELTPRELEVLGLIAMGKSNQEIARELVLSVRTVERHISNIYSKIGAGGAVARASATAYALQHGLVGPQLTESP